MNRLIVLFCLLSLPGFAQDWAFEKPDYDEIATNIRKQGTPLFYEALMQRFLEADSTFTLEEKRHLYYGYSFQEQYAPYAKSEFQDSLSHVLQKD
ncbi:DUF4919 domain-containing protein, partial [Echinicola sediminis]